MALSFRTKPSRLLICGFISNNLAEHLPHKQGDGISDSLLFVMLQAKGV
jgi:hypothetical protein